MLHKTPAFCGRRLRYSICFLCSTHAAKTHNASVSPNTMANPAVELAKGIPSARTFMPYRPLITVGTAISSVMLVRYFMALFRRLSRIELNSSRVPLISSR